MDQDFEKMTGAQLVDAYNNMVRQVCAGGKIGLRPVKKFETIAVGVNRCVNLRRSIDAHKHSDIPPELRRFDTGERVEPLPAEPLLASGEKDVSILNEADKRWRNWTPSKGNYARPRKATFARQIREERKRETEAAISAVADPPNPPNLGGASRTKRANRVIRLLIDGNPRRAGTDAHRFFSEMTGGRTVGEYLAKFPAEEQRKAAQWLWNTCKDGFAKLLG